MAKIKSFSAKVFLNGVAIGGLTDISAAGTDVTFIDTTDHGVVGGFRTFLAGLKDGGDLELTGKYDYEDPGQVEWKGEEGMVHPFLIILSDGSGFSFDAIVGGFQTSNPLDDAVEFTATAKITGPVYPVFPTITVTGTLTSDGATSVVFPPLVFKRLLNGRPYYSEAGATDLYANYWDSIMWVLSYNSDSAVWRSTDNVPTPLEVTTWIPFAPATGTPILTGS